MPKHDRHRQPKHKMSRNKASSGRVAERRYTRDFQPTFARHIRACCPTDIRTEDHLDSCDRDIRGCRDKIAYMSKAKAQAKAELMHEAYPMQDFVAYRCDDCEHFHVGKPYRGVRS